MARTTELLIAAVRVLMANSIRQFTTFQLRIDGCNENFDVIVGFSLSDSPDAEDDLEARCHEEAMRLEEARHLKETRRLEDAMRCEEARHHKEVERLREERGERARRREKATYFGNHSSYLDSSEKYLPRYDSPGDGYAWRRRRRSSPIISESNRPAELLPDIDDGKCVVPQL